ncbi:hypothetical protein [Arthrobacter bambusae]|uniref:Transposase DDE domain-containing protein n=1 Tax=Arthrobacter bambusae TaxID=1338426 RepID=A0AAW8DGV6_9MICC|nr:hypothetical protein [Arthrobacter bambusae]MDQ0129527.1 hypothetical protein [Arthrobacter bambusae]MDQ0180860.1 hypothetical protein [Arthrobacter bambusae]
MIIAIANDKALRLVGRFSTRLVKAVPAVIGVLRPLAEESCRARVQPPSGTDRDGVSDHPAGPTGLWCAAQSPAFDKEDNTGRNVVERNFNIFKQWRALATRYDKLALTYRGGAAPLAASIWLAALGDRP